ncbi:MAG: head-tail connector protein [Alphaproteobacteria bacterium]|nr:head-tail connector protein [Alphaproteobacteria bacterium]
MNKSLVNTASPEGPDAQARLQLVLHRFEAARKKRAHWENLWQECYDYALPQRGGFTGSAGEGQSQTGRIYDATAMDAADQLAASILGNLTPIWSQWFGLKPGPDLSPQEAENLAPILERAGKTIQDHFDRSNFAVEIHQCYLDLIVGGTASLFFEEAEPGSFSAFRFSAVPLSHVVLEEGENGVLDGVFRQMEMTIEQISARYPLAEIPASISKRAARDPQERFRVLEAVLPDGLAYGYHACLMEEGAEPALLSAGRFAQSPAISFRWLKSAGEIYGRSPIMTALPDIKTANKVVELILKNASIAVTGIWQADDDGVLNPANISLVPGSIIPKAVGSAGLQPLQMPGRFDISQLVLESLQSRIRHALLADRLAPVVGPRMTATEVLERSAEMSLLLGATYGRLQSELLTPLIKRAFAILKRRGEVPDIALDGRLVAVDYRSPLARYQGQRNVQNTLSWISSVLAMGPEAASAINLPQAARFLGEALGVPSDLVRKETPIIMAAQAAGTTNPL